MRCETVSVCVHVCVCAWAHVQSFISSVMETASKSDVQIDIVEIQAHLIEHRKSLLLVPCLKFFFLELCLGPQWGSSQYSPILSSRQKRTILLKGQSSLNPS